MSRNSQAKAPRKAGRPHGRAPRPHIQIDGDVLVPKTEAQELGVAVRTLTRMKPATTLFGGLADVAMGKLHQQIADGLSPKTRGRR
jgi:hypothetical protein